MEKSRFQKFLERAREQDAYWIAGATITFTEDLCRLMHEAGITRMELAERLGVSPAYVTKVLRGNANPTISTMVKLSRAAGGELHLRLTKESEDIKWFGVVTQRKETPAPPETGNYRPIALPVSRGKDVSNPTAA